jgi:hypothetical protein
MDEFLDAHDLLKLNQEDINYLNRFIKGNEIEQIIESPNKEKDQMGFTAEFYQALKEELTPMFLNLFCKIEREGMLPKSFYEVIIILIPKSDKEIIDQFP